MAKTTNKQRDDAIKWLMKELAQLQRVFSAYIDYKKDSADFQKHLIDLNEELKKKSENDTSNTSKVDS